jgi:hypothetical protein
VRQVLCGAIAGGVRCSTTGVNRIVVNLGDGNDRLDGGEGQDIMLADLGTMGIFSGAIPGANSYAGGPGDDAIQYNVAAGPLNLSLDDVANDGGADNVHTDVENVFTARPTGIFKGYREASRKRPATTP